MSRFSDPFVDPLYDPFTDPDAWPDPERPTHDIPDSNFSFEEYAANLTETQAEAAAHQGPILVLAGAGTGKTSCLTAAVVHRIAIDKIPAKRILAVTFTNKAAAEMTSRIRSALGGQVSPFWLGTYHGLAARQLRDQPEVAGLRQNFDILDADDSRRIIKRTMKALNLADSDDDEAKAGRDPLKIMCNQISKFKDSLLTPQGAKDHIQTKIANAERTGEPIHAGGLLASVRVYAAYQQSLRDANGADFGDLLLWPTLAMQRDEAYRTRWSSKFDWVAADEYQDVNFAQYSWLKLLSSRAKQIFVVGDDDQAIYSWRGADIAFIRQFVRDFPNARQIRLEENFRSTGHILAAANAVIAQDKKRLGKTLFTKKEQGDPIEIIAWRDGQAEAAGIVAEMLQLHGDGKDWDNFAILYRNNFLSRGLEEALMRARVPYVIVGDVGFYQRAEVKDALAFLRLTEAPDDRQSDEAFRRVINEPRRGYGAKAMDVVEAEAAFRNVSMLRALDTVTLPPKCHAAGLQFADAIRRVGNDHSHTLADQISLLLDATGYRAMLRDSKAETTEDRLENLQELIGVAGGFHTARELLDHATLATSRPGEDETARVRLMTLHKAKGLEFPHVFLPAWEAGVLPSDYGDRDEERRLAYVALTRGMRRVTISHCGFRRGMSVPSPFIDDIPDDNRVDGWLRDHLSVRRAAARAPIARRDQPDRFRRF